MRKLPDQVYYDLEAIHSYNVDVPNREIFITGEVDSVEGLEEGGEPGVEYIMAARVIRNFRFLAHRGDKDSPILAHLQTGGGYWTEGMAIYNNINNCPVPVIMINHTHASSMSSIIFQAPDYRVMMPDSTYMFHDGSYCNYGTLKQVKSELDFYDKYASLRMMDIYADSMLATKHSKFRDWTKVRIIKMMRKEIDKF